MRTWIFQGNPDDFDIDDYLAARPAELLWLVARYATEIAIDDRDRKTSPQMASPIYPTELGESGRKRTSFLKGHMPTGVPSGKEKVLQSGRKPLNHLGWK